MKQFSLSPYKQGLVAANGSPILSTKMLWFNNGFVDAYWVDSNVAASSTNTGNLSSAAGAHNFNFAI